MNAITERSLSGFNYLMIIGHISKETEKILTANGYEYSIFRHDVVQIHWTCRQQK